MHPDPTPTPFASASCCCTFCTDWGPFFPTNLCTNQFPWSSQCLSSAGICDTIEWELPLVVYLLPNKLDIQFRFVLRGRIASCCRDNNIFSEWYKFQVISNSIPSTNKNYSSSKCNGIALPTFAALEKLSPSITRHTCLIPTFQHCSIEINSQSLDKGTATFSPVSL